MRKRGKEAFKEKFKAFAAVEAEALLNLSKRAKKESELLAIGKEMDALQKDITNSTKGLTAAELEGNKEIQEKTIAMSNWLTNTLK